MGTLYRFGCPSCGYSAHVSGGDDCGFLVATRTVVCTRCREVMDVISSETPWDPESGASFCALRCPLCDGMVRPWRAQTCPRCGTPMERAEAPGVHWD